MHCSCFLCLPMCTHYCSLIAYLKCPKDQNHLAVHVPQLQIPQGAASFFPPSLSRTINTITGFYTHTSLHRSLVDPLLYMDAGSIGPFLFKTHWLVLSVIELPDSHIHMHRHRHRYRYARYSRTQPQCWPMQMAEAKIYSNHRKAKSNYRSTSVRRTPILLTNLQEHKH